MGERDHVARPIDDADVGRAVGRRPGRAPARAAEPGRHLARVGLGGQAVPRRPDVLGVAEVPEAVGEGLRDRLGPSVEALGGAPAHVRPGKRLQDVQDLEGGDPAGRARRDGELEAAVAAAERRGHPDGVVGQIFRGEEAALRAHLRRQRLGERPLVEGGGAVASEQLEASRQVGVADAVARLHPGRAIGPAALPEIGPRGLGERRQLLLELRGGEGQIPVGDDALAGEPDRRGQHRPEVHAAVALERQREPRDRARDRDRAVPREVLVALDPVPAEERSLAPARGQAIDPRVAGGRRADVEVEGDDLAGAGEGEKHGAPARDRAHEGLDDSHRESRRDRGVDRVAAARKDGGADLGAHRMLGDDQTLAGPRRLLRNAQTRPDHAATILRQT